MRRGSGLRHGSTAASPRPSPHAVSGLLGDDPRLERRPRVGAQALHWGRRGGDHRAIAALSPFVPIANDSESRHADPTGTPLALSDRLARDQPHRPLRSRVRALRAVQATARSAHRAAGRHRRHVVGCGHPTVARWPRSTATPPTGLCRAGRDPDDAQARLSRDRPPQSRSELQRTPLAESRCALSTLPHDPRCGRAPPTALVERLSPSRDRRPLRRPIQLGALPEASPRSGRPRAAPRSSAQRINRVALEARLPMALRFTITERPCHDRTLSKPQDDRDGATAPRR